MDFTVRCFRKFPEKIFKAIDNYDKIVYNGDESEKVIRVTGLEKTDFFSGIMSGLEEALAYEKGSAKAAQS